MCSTSTRFWFPRGTGWQGAAPSGRSRVKVMAKTWAIRCSLGHHHLRIPAAQLSHRHPLPLGCREPRVQGEMCRASEGPRRGTGGHRPNRRPNATSGSEHCAPFPLVRTLVSRERRTVSGRTARRDQRCRLKAAGHAPSAKRADEAEHASCEKEWSYVKFSSETEADGPQDSAKRTHFWATRTDRRYCPKRPQH
jgi:hypothetical protein